MTRQKYIVVLRLADRLDSVCKVSFSIHPVLRFDTGQGIHGYFLQYRIKFAKSEFAVDYSKGAAGAEGRGVPEAGWACWRT